MAAPVPEAMEGVNDALLGNMFAAVTQLSLVPELLEEAMTTQKLGGQKQAFAEACFKAWRCCWDDKVAMFAAMRCLLVELRKTETAPSETLRGNGFGSKVVSLYLGDHPACQAWLRGVLSPFVAAEGADEGSQLERLLQALCRAARDMPRSLKFLAFSVERETKGKATHGVALTSFLVLRFLLPALIAPAAHGVVAKDTPLPKEQQTRLVNLARSMQQLANHKTEDLGNLALLDRFLMLAIADPTDFADYTRIGAVWYGLERLPRDIDLSVLVQLVGMVGRHDNDNFERDVKRCRRLAAAVGDATFAEPYSTEPPPTGTVSDPVMGPRGESGERGKAGKRREESEEDTSEAWDDDEDDSSSDGESWAVCRFIRSFLSIPSVVRGEEPSCPPPHRYSRPPPSSPSSNSSSSSFSSRPLPSPRPPRLTVTAPDDDESQAEPDSEDSSSLSSLLGLSQDSSDKRERSGSVSRSSALASPRASMMKHILPGSSLTDEVWNM